MGAYEERVRAENGLTLSPTQYITVYNKQDGTIKSIKGPRIWFPETPFEEARDGVKEAISLKSNEYIRIENSLTGNVRVERGEQVVFPEPFEKVKDGVQTAVNIDAHTAVIIRNTKNGQVNLYTEPGLFFPGNYEIIEKVVKKIVLQDQHTIILKDHLGNYHFRTGGRIIGGKVEKNPKLKDEEETSSSKKKKGKLKDNNSVVNLPSNDSEDGTRAFFLPPFWEIVELEWAVGPTKLERKKIKVIDQRSHQMSYLFTVRTADSVELEIDCNFYWQIIDVELMISKTQNPTADICFHARSVISQAVSKLTLDKLQNNFNEVVNSSMLNPEDDFYEKRGLVVHSAEMRSLHCKDPSVEAILQDIIKETTVRINRLQKQTSENEVKLLQVQGDIEHEKLNAELLKIRRQQLKEDKSNVGESEAEQIMSFFSKFGGIDKLNSQVALDLWHTLRRTESVKALASGNSQLYLTPDDVNFQIFPKRK